MAEIPTATEIRKLRKQQKEGDGGANEDREVRQADLQFDDVRVVNIARNMTMDDSGNLAGFRLTYAVYVKKEFCGFVDCEFKPKGRASEFTVGLSKLVHARIRRSGMWKKAQEAEAAKEGGQA